MYPKGPDDGRVIFGSNAAPLTSSRHEFSQSRREKLPEAKALWRRTIKNPDASTGPLTWALIVNYWAFRIAGDLFWVFECAESNYDLKMVEKWPDRLTH